MKRGELYRVYKPGGDPKRYRTFAIVSRQALLDARFPSAICAPIHTEGQGLFTQVSVGPSEGLKHESWILCDALVSIQKSQLSQYIGSLSAARMTELDTALRLALDL